MKNLFLMLLLMSSQLSAHIVQEGVFVVDPNGEYRGL